MIQETNKTIKKPVLIFSLIAFLFSWPIMFIVDGWLIYHYQEVNQFTTALLILLVGHGLAMFGPAIAAFIVQRKIIKKKFVSWKWGQIKHYFYMTVFALLTWLIPGIVGFMLGFFTVELSIESYYKLYMLIYILLIPFSALGEELGWSSFLLSYLSPCIGKSKSIICSGIIRGIWHLPILLAPQIYRATKGEVAITTVLLMIFVFSFQLIISNILISSVFGFIWFNTSSSPSVGWMHLVIDLSRDFITIFIVGYASSTLGTMFAQLPIFILGVLYLDKVRKQDGYDKWKDLLGSKKASITKI
jgi:membrane protease YdiL (CAAX protease family)